MVINVFRCFIVVLLIYSSGSFADNAYRLVGVTRIYSTNPSASPNIELPVNAAFSSVIIQNGNSFSLKYDETSSVERNVKIKEKYPFSFDSAPLGSPEKLNKFLKEKFHTDSSRWTDIYLLQDTKSASCTALQFSTIYTSNSELVLLDEPFLYLFELENHRFRDASKSFDCGMAKTNVEHLICGNPRLQKMDASVNYGYVLMQRIYSKEISYQDPVRTDQMGWVLNVRNRCTTTDCLMKVYLTRIEYIKGKVSDNYPSYPEEEND